MNSKTGIINSARHSYVVPNHRKGLYSGTGHKTAARILGKMKTGDDLLREILEAERTYARTRRFWKF